MVARCTTRHARQALLAVILVMTTVAARAETWRELAPGLDLGRFASQDREAHPAGDLVVLRMDPRRWSLEYLSAADHGDRSRTAAHWCEDLGLVAAINAGMFQADGRSHVGFLQVAGEVRQPWSNDYLSVLALDPVGQVDPPFRLVDLDADSLRTVRSRWGTVIQNLRLARRPRENRWPPQDRRWSEAALGEDSDGRALFIFCKTARSMHDLIDILLALPLDLVAAQHLEGGQHAQLSIRAPGCTLDLSPGDPTAAPPVPNVLGVAPRP